VRITNSIITRQSLDGVQRNLAAMEEAQRRVTTGVRIERPSDDPAAAVSLMGTDRQLRALNQYGRNIDAAISRLSAEETALDGLTGLLERARELAVSQSGSNATAQTRAITKLEVDQLLEAAIGLGNTQFAGAYIFGGPFPDSPPFAADGTTSTARPPVGVQPVEIDQGQRVTVSHDGVQVFVDTEALAALQDLSAALGANSTADIQSAVGRLERAHDNVQGVLGETGSFAQRLEVAGANVESLELTLKAFRSDLGEVEMEEAISQLVARQTAFQAALAATARMASTTLTDYLR
jgi:flagellar hook-associated protein 3 FlgL